MLEESKEHGGRSGNYYYIMDENLGHIEDMSKKYGSNFLIEIQGAPGDVFWKGLATLPLHLAASYRRVKSMQSMQSLLSTGADPELRDQLGQTTLHLVIAGWPRILTNWPKPGSKFQTTVIGVCRQAEACLRLLCEHGVNVNAEVESLSYRTSKFIFFLLI
ncbi:ankyrin repeat domain-containing protein 61 isoform X2 [Perca flavescens]|uniref:ankyrin repeat domain-containing protein 61 isoform X2 n=1 Tax=Perca flavescens TaxID=8167 RepID=UPI00106E99ED|nr:ankyrin repeat domain-containing protein 61 isoform X2 [Perca flavescens]